MEELLIVNFYFHNPLKQNATHKKYVTVISPKSLVDDIKKHIEREPEII